MKKILFLTLTASVALLVISCSSTPSDPQEAAAAALAERVMGRRCAKKVLFRTAPADTCDYFTVTQKGCKVLIEGNSSNSMAKGLNHYLKYWCNAEYGWFINDTISLRGRLPRVKEPVTVRARVGKRFFLNYCTFGYTMPWWQWADWEHFIDWMALNGINLPLAITGQESIWYQIWTEMGLTDEEVRAYFTGPAHLPWHRMQNIDRWFGPLPKSWLEGQTGLQKQIVARERELGMKPVLPAFAGHVPAELARIYPDAPLTKLEAWSGFSDYYACTFLDPMSELYTEIQKSFVEKETEIYGTDHIYGIDIFNELMPPSWEPSYLGRVSRQIYESLEKADPEAIWLQMGWLFYNERQYWTNDRVEAYLTSFPTDRQILLDYFCESMEVWQRTECFYGVPYIWCYLGNFGGNTFIAGNVKEIDRRIENTFVNGGGNFGGIGATLEGFDCNPYLYEFVLEKAWDNEEVKEPGTWFAKLAARRCGVENDSAREAWQLLLDSVYAQRTTPGQTPMVSERPDMGKTSTYYSSHRYIYDNKALARAVELLIEAKGSGNAYEFDLTNLVRQTLSNYFDGLKTEYEAAYSVRDREKMDSLAVEMLGIEDDIDRLLNTQTYFLVGKWIADARHWGTNDEEKEYFEKNARNLITTWSDGDMVLNDYAARTLAGLTATLYKPRYELFFNDVDAALDRGEEWNDENRRVYHAKVTAMEKDWWDKCVGEFSATTAGDSKTIAIELFNKYKGEILK